VSTAYPPPGEPTPQDDHGRDVPPDEPTRPDQEQPYSAVQEGAGSQDREESGATQLPSYGQQPGYGEQPSYEQPGSQPPPPYGQPPPAYGEPPPAYGEQPPAYGEQPPAYGEQPPAYGQQQPPPTYGQPPPAYGEQLPAYGQQPAAYGEQPWSGAPVAQPWDNSAYGTPMAGALPKEAYASWGQRVGAYLIDFGIFFVLAIIAGIVIAVGASRSSSSYDPATSATATHFDPLVGIGYLLLILVVLAQLAFTIWNRWVRAGRTGMSIGKERMGIKLVGVESGAPIGGGKAFLRDFVRGLIGYVPIVPLVDLLFPLWDDKRQTLTDKIMSTVVVKNR
jgi:uncharacterized RDD family membrane protein YckC